MLANVSANVRLTTSESRPWALAVDPTRSANSTVTSFRSSGTFRP